MPEKIIVDGVEYEFSGSGDIHSCKGCAGLPGIKQCVAVGGNITETLCHKLGRRCLKENSVWKKVVPCLT